MRTKFIFSVLGLLLCYGGLAQANNWNTLDYPGASATYVRDISGNNLVGFYDDASNHTHGFLYNGTTWTNFDMQGSRMTRIDAIDGGSYAGVYWDTSGEHGFWYNGTSLTTFEMPHYGDRLNVGGLSGETIAGDYRRYSPGTSGFLYNGITWTEVTIPLGSISNIYGIDENKLVGTYNGSHGFLYDGTTGITIDVPEMLATTPQDIDGENIVGYFQDYDIYMGFLYDGSTYTTIEIPGAIRTFVTGIDGNNLVGYYMDTSYNTHGFFYTIPEPATMSFLLIGILGVSKLRR